LHLVGFSLFTLLYRKLLRSLSYKLLSSLLPLSCSVSAGNHGVIQTAFSRLPLGFPTERLRSKPPPVTVRGYENHPS